MREKLDSNTFDMGIVPKSTNYKWIEGNCERKMSIDHIFGSIVHSMRNSDAFF